VEGGGWRVEGGGWRVEEEGKGNTQIKFRKGVLKPIGAPLPVPLSITSDCLFCHALE
jgi:hypothetical protein